MLAFLGFNFDEEDIQSFFDLLTPFSGSMSFRGNNCSGRQIILEKSNPKTYRETTVRGTKTFSRIEKEKMWGHQRKSAQCPLALRKV